MPMIRIICVSFISLASFKKEGKEVIHPFKTVVIQKVFEYWLLLFTSNL
jgi:hypothetical protein